MTLQYYPVQLYKRQIKDKANIKFSGEDIKNILTSSTCDRKETRPALL